MTDFRKYVFIVEFFSNSVIINSKDHKLQGFFYSPVHSFYLIRVKGGFYQTKLEGIHRNPPPSHHAIL